MSEWQLLKAIPGRDLSDARLKAHFAAQLVGSASGAIVPEQADYGHTALHRLVGTSLLAGGWFGAGDSRRRVALAPAELRLSVLDGNLSETASFLLDGHTLDEGRQWLIGTLGHEFDLIDYEMPPHPVRDGGAFTREDDGALEAIGRGFVNASTLLTSHDGGDVRCWPHHFDIAYLLELGNDKSIGVGWSPGDTSYDEPYWYVAPWPHPAGPDRPELPGGHWHHEGFVAAILTTSAIGAHDAPEDEMTEVESFVTAAIGGSRALLE